MRSTLTTQYFLEMCLKVKVEVLSDAELLTAFKDALQKINDGAGYSSDEDSDLEEWWTSFLAAKTQLYKS